MAKPTVFGFDERDAKILADMAQRELTTPSSASEVTLPMPRNATTRQYLAKTSANAITARAGDTPGTGVVTLMYLNKSSGNIEPWQNGSGADITRTVYSYATSPSGADTYVWISADVFGTLWYANEACSGV